MNPISKPNILVADPDANLLSRTVNALAPANYQVFAAVCRASAHSAARSVSLDLLLVDLSLASHGPGSDLIEEIHALPDCSDIPVIFTAPGQGPDVIRRQHDFGGAYHVKTPFDSTVLITLIERALWMPHLVQTHIARPHFNLGISAAANDYWNQTTVLSPAGE